MIDQVETVDVRSKTALIKTVSQLFKQKSGKIPYGARGSWMAALRSVLSDFLEKDGGPILLTTSYNSIGASNALTLSAMIKNGYGIQFHIMFHSRITALSIDLIVDTCPKFAAKMADKLVAEQLTNLVVLPQDYSTVRRYRLTSLRTKSSYAPDPGTLFRKAMTLQFDVERKDFNLVDYAGSDGGFLFTHTPEGPGEIIRIEPHVATLSPVVGDNSDFFIVLNTKFGAGLIEGRSYHFPFQEGTTEGGDIDIMAPAVVVRQIPAFLFRVIPATKITLNHLTKGPT